jgi:hypothetical protein
MNTMTSTENGATHTITTTLFDLLDAMQQHATTPQAEAMIVPTVVDWLRSGRLTFADGLTTRPAA